MCQGLVWMGCDMHHVSQTYSGVDIMTCSTMALSEYGVHCCDIVRS